MQNGRTPPHPKSISNEAFRRLWNPDHEGAASESGSAVRPSRFREAMTRQPAKHGDRSKPGRSRLTIASEIVVAMAVLAAGWWLFQPGGYFRPISFPDEAVYDHLPADRPERLKHVVRVAGATTDHPYVPEFGIVVNKVGRPGRVELLPTNIPQDVPPPAMLEAAIAEIQNWTFVPFRAEDRPVYARFTARFALSPEQDRPSTHIPFPQVVEPAQVVMTYDERGIRRLPRSVTVHGDGEVEIANTSVRSTQHFQATISKSQVLTLIDAYRRADFFSLKEFYGGGPSEPTARTVSITIDGQTKTVHDDEGQFGGLPDAVMSIEEALQRAGGLAP